MNINSVILVGYLAKDPIIVSGKDAGTTVTKMTIAVNRSVRMQDGTWKETPDFVAVTLFGKTAENAAAFLKKGSLAGINGRATTSVWQDDNGNKNYKQEIIAQRLFLGPKAAQQPDQQPSQQQEPVVDKAATAAHTSPDDIPF